MSPDELLPAGHALPGAAPIGCPSPIEQHGHRASLDDSLRFSCQRPLELREERTSGHEGEHSTNVLYKDFNRPLTEDRRGGPVAYTWYVVR